MDETTPRRRRATTSSRVDKSAPAYRVVVERFGGLTNFCEQTGFNPSTVHRWLRNGFVPAKWYRDGQSYPRYIMWCARLHEVELSAEDFLEDPDD